MATRTARRRAVSTWRRWHPTQITLGTRRCDGGVRVCAMLLRSSAWPAMLLQLCTGECLAGSVQLLRVRRYCTLCGVGLLVGGVGIRALLAQSEARPALLLQMHTMKCLAGSTPLLRAGASAHCIEWACLSSWVFSTAAHVPGSRQARCT